jgi:hypothetical protein
MLSVSPGVKIFLYAQAADLRRGYDGLASIVQEAMGEDPLSGSLFLFVNKRGNRIKLFYWDRDGYLCKVPPHLARILDRHLQGEHWRPRSQARGGGAPPKRCRRCRARDQEAAEAEVPILRSAASAWKSKCVRRGRNYQQSAGRARARAGRADEDVRPRIDL